MPRVCHRRLLAFVLVVLSCLALCEGKLDRPLQFFTKNGNLQYALEKNVDAFKELTGIEVEVTGVEFGEVYEGIKEDLDAGSKKYDGFVYVPGWMFDFHENLEVLTERVRLDRDLEWLDISVFFRRATAELVGEIYAVPLDGDVHFAYYRIDLLEEHGLTPPRTWDEFIEICEFFYQMDSHDWNNDGEEDYIACIPKGPNASNFWFLMDFVAPYIQHRGSRQGAFFDIDDMTPLVDNEGFRAGVQKFYETNKYGMPEQFDVGFEVPPTRAAFTEGRCIFALDWGDLPLAANNTAFADTAGTLIMPGSEYVVNRETGVFEKCDLSICPYATYYPDGKLVNHAPYAALGGWTGSVARNNDEERKTAAYNFLSFVSRPAQSNRDMLDELTGVQAYRHQHLQRSTWEEFNIAPRIIDTALTALEATLQSPNLVIDWRIPSTQDYNDAANERQYAFLTADEMDVDEFATQLAADYERITDEAGRAQQLDLYRDAIGLPPVEDGPTEVERSDGMTISMMVVSSILIFLSLVLLVVICICFDKPIIRYSSPVFLIMIIIGGIMIYAAVLLWAFDPSTAICTSALWCGLLGFTLLLSPLFVKTWRVYRLFSNESFKVIVVRTWDVLPYIGINLLLTIIILSVWTGLDAPSDHRTTSGLDEDDEYTYICDSPDHGLPMMITTVVYFGFMLLVGCCLGFMTRNVAAAFNEARWVAVSMYLISFALLLTVVVVFTIEQTDVQYILISVFVLVATTVTLMALFLPKLYFLAVGRHLSTSNFDKSRHNMTDFNNKAVDPSSSSTL